MCSANYASVANYIPFPVAIILLSRHSRHNDGGLMIKVLARHAAVYCYTFSAKRQAYSSSPAIPGTKWNLLLWNIRTSSVCVLPSGVWLNDNFVSLATCKKFANQCLHKYMKGVEAVNKWFMFSTVWYSYSYWMGEVVEAAGEELTLKYVLCRTWCESNRAWNEGPSEGS